MKDAMRLANSKLAGLLATHPATNGMYVRIHGAHLILGRREPGPNGEDGDDDRVRLTRLTSTKFGLSVKRHTGRWERTPFSGDMEELVGTVLQFMQHLIAPY
jgi:hypothetical protein